MRGSEDQFLIQQKKGALILTSAFGLIVALWQYLQSPIIQNWLTHPIHIAIGAVASLIAAWLYLGMPLGTREKSWSNAMRAFAILITWAFSVYLIIVVGAYGLYFALAVGFSWSFLLHSLLALFVGLQITYSINNIQKIDIALSK